jgi:hypothetical protein
LLVYLTLAERDTEIDADLQLLGPDNDCIGVNRATAQDEGSSSSERSAQFEHRSHSSNIRNAGAIVFAPTANDHRQRQI